jgi:DNA mismatch endonuclease (patch repair protein)
MQSNRGRDTGIELKVRSALHRDGLRFRKHVRPLPWLRCNADVVFPREHLAVFIDGCYWHSCPVHATVPKTNADWWKAKLHRTRERDRLNAQELTAAGWHVLRVWEHEDVDEIVARVKEALTRLRSDR